MKTKALIFALALGASTCALMAQEGNNTPDNQPPPPRHEGGPGAGPRGRGGPGGFHILPPRAQEQLKLTADQQKQIAALEAKVKAKMEKILTPDQLQQLKQMRASRMRGGPGGQRGTGAPDGEQSGGHQPPPGQ